jgi:hypothetical protein
MSAPSPLPPEDDFFGRVAVHNKLVSREQVDECAGMILDDVAEGRPRRSLASLLIGRGYISAVAAAAVQKAVSDYAARQFGKATPAPGAPPEPKPMPRHAPAGMSQQLEPVRERTSAPDNRFKLDAPEKAKAAILTVECHRLYAQDGPALEAACHRLMSTDRPDLRLDMRQVENIPSVIIGIIGKCATEAARSKRDFLLLCTEACAKMVRLVAGSNLRIKTGRPPRGSGLRMRNTP